MPSPSSRGSGPDVVEWCVSESLLLGHVTSRDPARSMSSITSPITFQRGLFSSTSKTADHPTLLLELLTLSLSRTALPNLWLHPSSKTEQGLVVLATSVTRGGCNVASQACADLERWLQALALWPWPAWLAGCLAGRAGCLAALLAGCWLAGCLAGLACTG